MENLLGKNVIITLRKSTIATVPKHREFVRTPGLRRPGDQRECTYTANIHGMVKQISYLVDVVVKG